MLGTCAFRKIEDREATIGARTWTSGATPGYTIQRQLALAKLSASVWVLTVVVGCGARPQEDVVRSCFGYPTFSSSGDKIAVPHGEWATRVSIMDRSGRVLSVIRLPSVAESWVPAAWSSDGERIALTLTGFLHNRDTTPPGGWGIWAASTGSAQVRNVAHILDEILQRPIWCRGSDYLVCRAAFRKDLVLVSTSDGTCKFLTNCGDVYRLGWDISPSDKASVFLSRGYMSQDPEAKGIWTMKLDGTGMTRLTAAYEAEALRVSPTGRLLGFTAAIKDDPLKWDLYLGWRDPGRMPRLVAQRCDRRWFAWSHDSRSLVFVRDGDIWLYTVASQTTQSLTRGFRACNYPACDPLGEIILFVNEPYELWAFDLIKHQPRVFMKHREE